MHVKINHKNPLFVSLLVFATWGCGAGPFKQNSGSTETTETREIFEFQVEGFSINYTDINRNYQSIMHQDFISFHEIPWDQNLIENSSLGQILELKEISSTALMEWLEDRIKVITIGKLSYYPLKLVNHKDDIIFRMDEENENSLVYASNLGAALYTAAKKHYSGPSHFSKAEPFFQIQLAQGWTDVLTPRAGIINFHDKFFKEAEWTSKSGSMLRLAVFFHEARHSDGNEDNHSLGFPHIKCPEYVGKEYANKMACDGMVNGPYSVGGNFYKEALQLCKDTCSEQMTAILEMAMLDSFSRVVSEKIFDPTPQPPSTAMAN